MFVLNVIEVVCNFSIKINFKQITYVIVILYVNLLVGEELLQVTITF